LIGTSITRPPFKHKTLENVLFVGASSRPGGNGVPLVLIGAKNLADYAVKRLKAKMRNRKNHYNRFIHSKILKSIMILMWTRSSYHLP